MTLPGSPAFRGAWEQTIKAAEAANTPGTFTAFIGYEWTSNTGGNNLHRVIIFREGASKAGQTEPFTAVKPLGSDNPRDLWKWMNAYEEKTGGHVLAIAHNGVRPMRPPERACWYDSSVGGTSRPETRQPVVRPASAIGNRS